MIFQTLQSLQILNRSFSDFYLCIINLGYDRKSANSSKRGRDVITAWHFATKCKKF